MAAFESIKRRLTALENEMCRADALVRSFVEASSAQGDSAVWVYTFEFTINDIARRVDQLAHAINRSMP